MALGLVTGIIAVLAVGSILCINDNSRKKGIRPRRGTDNDLMLKQLSFDDLHTMPRVALVLYVDNVHLAHGSDDEMAETLHQHYQQLTEPTSAQSESGLSTGNYPDKLKLVKVITNKGGFTQDLNNFHPISLLSVFDKIIAKIIHSTL